MSPKLLSSQQITIVSNLKPVVLRLSRLFKVIRGYPWLLYMSLPLQSSLGLVLGVWGAHFEK